MKGIIYYAPTAQRAKHVSHSNVGAEHCSALIDQRDRLRFSGLDALGRKTTLSLRYVTSRKGVRESHLAEGGTACGGVGALRRRFVSDFIRRAQHADAPTARRAKTVSHSRVGAEHCSALIDQRDRLHFSGPDVPGAKNDSIPSLFHFQKGF